MQETVTFSGIIIGEGQRVRCEVRATKTTLDGDPPLFSGYRIMESDVTDRLPDGNYELLVTAKELDSAETPDVSNHGDINWLTDGTRTCDLTLRLRRQYRLSCIASETE